MAKELGRVKEEDYTYYAKCLSKDELINFISFYYGGCLPKSRLFKYRFSRKFDLERVDYSNCSIKLSAVHHIGLGFVRVYVDIYNDDLEDFIHNEYIYRLPVFNPDISYDPDDDPMVYDAAYDPDDLLI